MENEITKSHTGLWDEAIDDIPDCYMRIAAKFDAKYGKNWSKENASIVATLTNSVVHSYNGAILAKTLQETHKEFCQKLDYIALQLENISHNL